MKRLHTDSQNFIRSPKIVESLIGRSNLKKDDIVYDLGAGSGVITSALASRVAKVVAIEQDARLIETLQRNLGHYLNVKIINADILTFSFPLTPYKIFANIPFHLSSPIVNNFVNNPRAPQSAYLIVQKQFGRKLVATDTTHFTSQLGMIIGAEYEVRVIKNLQKTDFMPRPAVDTVCIELKKRTMPLIDGKKLSAFQKYTIECFSDPKKLAQLPLEKAGITKGASPSRLSLDQWILLFNIQTRYT